MAKSDCLMPKVPSLLVQFDEKYCAIPQLNDVLRNRFVFIGETHDLGAKIDWLKNPSADLEWQILWHKFYFAPGLIRQWLASGQDKYQQCFVDLVSSWITQVPATFIASDVTARRVQNWTYAWYCVEAAGKRSAFEESFVSLLEDSVREQVESVIVNMAPARNHRTLELYAVFVASLGFPAIAEAARWRVLAVDNMVENIRSDLQADGVHCEQSSDYHHLALRSYLLFFKMAGLNGIILPADIAERLCRALEFSLHIHRPNGTIPALSDSDSHPYGSLLRCGAELFCRPDFAYGASAGALGVAPPARNTLFKSSGYVVMRSDWLSHEPFEQARHLVLDAGPVGEGNHGHMDALSIEMAAYGQPLIIDPGRYTYHEDESFDWRAAFRSTRAHNTVTVDDQDQGIYRRKRPAARYKIQPPHPQASIVRSQLDAEPAFVQAKVISPNYPVIHHRSVWFVQQRYWVLLDSLINTAPDEHDYRLRHQLTPQARGAVQINEEEGFVQVDTPALTVVTGGHGPLVACIEEGWVSEQYGIKHPAPRLCLMQRARQAVFLSVLLPKAVDRRQQPQVTGLSSSNGHLGFAVTTCGKSDYWRWDGDAWELSLLSATKSRQWSMGEYRA